MEPDTSPIRTYLAKLGLAPEIADIYLSLHTHGPQSMSGLARTSGVERTRIYRLMGQLAESHLVEPDDSYQPGLYRAAPVSNLHLLINQKEQEVAALKEELDLIEQVLGRNTLDIPGLRFQAFTGTQGLRQLLWNVTQATTPVYSYKFMPFEEYVGAAFTQQWHQATNRSDWQEFCLVGDNFMTAWHGLKPAGQLPAGTAVHFVTQPQLPITHSCLVYNNVVAYVYWTKTGVMGTETHHRGTADAQRLLLRNLWDVTKPERRI